MKFCADASAKVLQNPNRSNPARSTNTSSICAATITFSAEDIGLWCKSRAHSFPLYDRNPQKYVNNIFLAKETNFQTATQRIYRCAKYPSHINVSTPTC